MKEQIEDKLEQCSRKSKENLEASKFKWGQSLKSESQTEIICRKSQENIMEWNTN